ncbi:MAG TPA: cytochrome c oxidase subunit II [Geobacteraceae bacterium]
MNAQLLTTTQAVDPVFMFIFGVALVLLCGITLVMVGFVIRYHRSRAPVPTSRVASNIWLEIVWTVLPAMIVMAMFYYGWAGYLALRNAPPGALPVTATASMWNWSFRYENGRTSPKLYVPVGRPVLVTLVSRDVLHGFFLPAFRVKRDIVPGMDNQAWFVATRPGSYDLFCSQYCGTGHSAMITTVEALPAAEFSAWLAQQPVAAGPAGRLDGAKLAREKGCLACHTLDGKPGVGPTFKGLYGSQVTVRQAGRLVTVTADEAYLRESVKMPGAMVVEGFKPLMPSYPDLADAELEALVQFIKEAR